ncbi:hypothetical protein KIPB_003541, partial [Kipferlia bialata]|eukprot:g3541.t1
MDYTLSDTWPETDSVTAGTTVTFTLSDTQDSYGGAGSISACSYVLEWIGQSLSGFCSTNYSPSFTMTQAGSGSLRLFYVPANAAMTELWSVSDASVVAGDPDPLADTVTVSPTTQLVYTAGASLSFTVSTTDEYGNVMAFPDCPYSATWLDESASVSCDSTEVVVSLTLAGTAQPT